MQQRILCTWAGASGRVYRYEVYPRHPMLVPPEPGNYIYARVSASGGWTPVIIGQGDAVARAVLERRLADRAETPTVTHIHFHGNPDPSTRRREELDLLRRHGGAEGRVGA